MTETTDSAAQDAKIERIRDLIATATADTVKLPNAAAWPLILLKLEAGRLPSRLAYELRAEVAWPVRKALKAQVAKNPALSPEETCAAARKFTDKVL